MVNFHIEFDSVSIEDRLLSELPLCCEKLKAVSNERKNLFDKVAIEQAENFDGKYISDIFTEEKKNEKLKGL